MHTHSITDRVCRSSCNMFYVCFFENYGFFCTVLNVPNYDHYRYREDSKIVPNNSSSTSQELFQQHKAVIGRQTRTVVVCAYSRQTVDPKSRFPLSHRPFIYAPQWLLLPGDIGTIVWPPPCPSMPGAYGPFLVMWHSNAQFQKVAAKLMTTSRNSTSEHLYDWDVLLTTQLGYARLIAHSDRKRRGIWGHGNILGRLAEDFLIEKSLCQVLFILQINK